MSRYVPCDHVESIRRREHAATAARRQLARIGAAIRKSPMTRHERAIVKRLVGLWSYWGKRGWIDPTVAELAAHAGCGERTATRVLQRLANAGFIAADPAHKGGHGVRRRLRVNIKRMREALRGMIARARYMRLRQRPVLAGLTFWLGAVLPMGAAAPPVERHATAPKKGATIARVREIYPVASQAEPPTRRCRGLLARLAPCARAFLGWDKGRAKIEAEGSA